MSKLELIKDNELKKPNIAIPLNCSSRDELGQYYDRNWQQLQQSSVYGILTPLIMVNKVVVDFKDVENFTLKSTGPIPQLYFEIHDRDKLLSVINTPGLDNQVVIQIIPPFDNAYKKINLIFAVSNVSIKNDVVKINGTYKVPKLLSSSFKSFGEITTFDLFKQIADDTGLGFATNCVSDEADKRYIYSDNSTLLEVMSREITRSNSDSTHIYDYWVDFWDNINYVNMYDQYNSKASDEDLMIWIAGIQNEFEEGVKIRPIKSKAVINNHPMFAESDLKANEYEIINNTGTNIGGGTDKVYSVFEDAKGEYLDYLVQDGDVKEDIYTKFEYLGENYGKYNYLLATACRQTYIKKMNTETIKVTIKKPLLALMRGHKVEFAWYINDDGWNGKMKNLSDAGLIKDSKYIKINGSLEDHADLTGANTTDGKFVLDKSVSGQYTIIGCEIKYYMGEWYYDLLLTRPHVNKPNMISDANEATK